MTCKDCLHCDVCGHRRQFTAVVVEDRCKTFKDKSRFIELPSKVEDTFYGVDKWRKYTTKQAIDNYHNLKEDYPSIRLNVPLEKSSHMDICSQFGDFEFGINAIIAREEAKKALKEREKE